MSARRTRCTRRRSGHAACARAILSRTKSMDYTTARRVDGRTRTRGMRRGRRRCTRRVARDEGAAGRGRRWVDSSGRWVKRGAPRVRSRGWMGGGGVVGVRWIATRETVGRTALHRRADARSGGEALCRALDVDVVNDDGYTPLQSRGRKPEIVAPLVNAGARLRARTRNAGASFGPRARFWRNSATKKSCVCSRSPSSSRERRSLDARGESQRGAVSEQMRRASERRVGLAGD